MKRMTAMLLALALLLCGCGPAKKEQTEQKTICVVLKAMDSVHWMNVENGLQQAARDLNVSVNILYPKSENDVRTQEVMIQNAIASKPDALAVAPCDSSDMEMLKEAEHSGVPVFYIDTASDKYDFPYIGSNNYQIGIQAAQAMIAQMKEGKIAIITGSLLQSTHKERTQSFQNYIQTYSALQICTVKENPNSSDIGSMDAMRQILAEYPDVKGVFCTSAMMVLGAMQERKRQGYSGVELIGVDAQSDALLAVEQGEILAMIGQDGYQIGYQTVKTIVQALHGEQVQDKIFVDNALITQENVKEYLEK